MEKRTKFQNTDSEKPNYMFSTRGTRRTESVMTEGVRAARRTLTKVELLPLQ